MARISSSRLDMEDGRIDRAIFKDYGETLVGGTDGANSSTAYTIDLENGNAFHVILTGNCTFTFSNPSPVGSSQTFTLFLKQDMVGSRTVTWPSSVQWVQGYTPTLTSQKNRYDTLQFTTTDAGSTWLGFVGSQNFVEKSELWTWGSAGTSGQLGLGDAISRSSPQQVGAMNDWAQITTGFFHVAAIKPDGTLWTWGTPISGQLGHNSGTVARSSPTQVGALTDWAKVSAGVGHTLALKTNGSLWAWGYNADGELGNGLSGTVNRSSPIQVGALTTWAQVEAAGIHSLAIKTDGTLWSWGWGGQGRLGHNSTINRSSPTQVGAATDWAKVIGGGALTLALKTTGALWVWGRNTYGQLGLGDIINRSSPVQLGSLTDWADISSAVDAVIALKTDGTIWGWGRGSEGQLGKSDRQHRSSPVQIGNSNQWAQISSGIFQTAAIKKDNTLWAWGRNTNGELGINKTTSTSSPVQVGTAANWAHVAADQYFTAARRFPGPGTITVETAPEMTLWSWGELTDGRLGLNDVIDRSSPTQVGALTTWATVAAGAQHTLALKTDGTLWSWGTGTSGRLGNNNTNSRSSPTQVGALTNWAAVHAGYAHSLAVKTDGTLWSWGAQSFAGGSGTLGLGDTTARSSPTQVGALATWDQVATSTYNSLALKTDGTLWAWGGGPSNLGLNSAIQRSSPTQIGALTTWSKINMTVGHTLALKNDGTLWSWGTSADGQIGHGDVISRSSPTQVGTDTDWAALGGGNTHSHAIKTDGTLWSWGGLTSGKQGQNDLIERSSPTQVGTATNWIMVKGHANRGVAIRLGT